MEDKDKTKEKRREEQELKEQSTGKIEEKEDKKPGPFGRLFNKIKEVWHNWRLDVYMKKHPMEYQVAVAAAEREMMWEEEQKRQQKDQTTSEPDKDTHGKDEKDSKDGKEEVEGKDKDKTEKNDNSKDKLDNRTEILYPYDRKIVYQMTPEELTTHLKRELANGREAQNYIKTAHTRHEPVPKGMEESINGKTRTIAYIINRMELYKETPEQAVNAALKNPMHRKYVDPDWSHTPDAKRSLSNELNKVNAEYINTIGAPEVSQEEIKKAEAKLVNYYVKNPAIMHAISDKVPNNVIHEIIAKNPLALDYMSSDMLSKYNIQDSKGRLNMDIAEKITNNYSLYALDNMKSISGIVLYNMHALDESIDKANGYAKVTPLVGDQGHLPLKGRALLETLKTEYDRGSSVVKRFQARLPEYSKMTQLDIQTELRTKTIGHVLERIEKNHETPSEAIHNTLKEPEYKNYVDLNWISNKDIAPIANEIKEANEKYIGLVNELKQAKATGKEPGLSKDKINEITEARNNVTQLYVNNPTYMSQIPNKMPKSMVQDIIATNPATIRYMSESQMKAHHIKDDKGRLNINITEKMVERYSAPELHNVMDTLIYTARMDSENHKIESDHQPIVSAICAVQEKDSMQDRYHGEYESVIDQPAREKQEREKASVEKGHPTQTQEQPQKSQDLEPKQTAPEPEKTEKGPEALARDDDDEIVNSTAKDRKEKTDRVDREGNKKNFSHALNDRDKGRDSKDQELGSKEPTRQSGGQDR